MMTSKLLEELKSIKVALPESECFVPEWDRAVKLRGFTVGEGLKIGNLAEKSKGSGGLIAVAHSIVDGDERPLANDDGVELIRGLTQDTFLKLARAIEVLAGKGDEEKNSAATGTGAISSELPASSDAQSLN